MNCSDVTSKRVLGWDFFVKQSNIAEILEVVEILFDTAQRLTFKLLWITLHTSTLYTYMYIHVILVANEALFQGPLFEWFVDSSPTECMVVG